MKAFTTLFMKEFKHLFNNPMGYLFCSMLPATLAYFLFWQNSGLNIFVNGTSDLRLFFRLAPFLLAVFVPLLAMRAWAEEMRQGTMEWLLSMPLPHTTLVWAKFLAPFTAILITLAATLTFPYTLVQLGDLDLGPVLSGYIGLLLFSATALAFSLWISSMTRHQVVAFLFSFLIFSFFAFFENSPLNLNFRLQQMASGLLDLKDLVYFLSLTLFFLFMSIQFLGQARHSGFLSSWKPYKLTRILFVAGIFIALNAAVNYTNLRVDFTRNGIYTLSPSTKEVCAHLDEETHLKLFFSSNLPPQFQPVLAFIERLAAEYEAHGKGKFQVQKLNPDLDEAARREALSYGVVETAGNVTQKSRVETVKIWFGMVLTQGERKVVFPTMQDIPNLEYDLTAALLKLNHTTQKKVLLAGSMPPSPLGHDPENDMKPMLLELQKQYNLEHGRVVPDKIVPFEHADALITWGVREFSENQLKELDAFIQSGKPVLLFTSGVSIQLPELTARELPKDPADALFEHYGFEVGRNLVSDNSCQRIQSSTNSRLQREYPVFPMVSRLLDGFPLNFKPVETLQTMTLPWCSTVTPLSNDQTQTLLQSSKQAWLQERVFDLNPDTLPGPTSFNVYPMGVLVSGVFDPYFDSTQKSTDNTVKMVVIGSNEILGQYQNPSSLAFIANTLGFWCSDMDLSDIDRRENAFVPLPANLTYETRRTYQWITLLTGPLFFALWGTVFYARRRTVNYGAHTQKRANT
ncbi:MAG: hypothetical protein CSA81_02890 [Acidobacteria bacterium]|nr:MAG: hypothetical protein CSA81_02890 [Acidobacteriota bacterium]